MAILFSKNINKQNLCIDESYVDPNGRWIKLIIRINEKRFRLLCVYAPNNEAARVKFFVDLQAIVQDDIDAEIIMGGDFNCTMNSIEDRYNCSSKNDVGQVDLHYLCNLFDLEDIWRRRHPDTQEFTWFGRDKKSRLDFWLTSCQLYD